MPPPWPCSPWPSVCWLPPRRRPDAQGQVGISFFYEALAPHGDWVDHPRYGRVWYPRDVDYDWRPYTRGRWANTTEHGWLWVSEEPWGWAPYHYGRWTREDRYGWVWVPGEQWGPAWVEWRHGNGIVGWTPLPPEARWQGGRISYSERIDYYAPQFRPAWVFVSERNFTSHRLHSHCEPPARNITFFNRTTNVTNYTVVNQAIVNRSVSLQRIETATGGPVPVVGVTAVDRPGGHGHGGHGRDRSAVGAKPEPTTRADTVPVFRPLVTGRDGRPALAAGVTAAAVAQATARPGAHGQQAQPATVTAGTQAPTSATPGAVTAAPAPPTTRPANVRVAKAAEPAPATPAAGPAAAAPTATTPSPASSPAAGPASERRHLGRVIRAGEPAASRPAGETRIKAVYQRQKADREALQRRHEQERAKASLIRKPGLYRDQIREKVEQRRIHQQQRVVVNNRPTPPNVPRAQPQRPIKRADGRQAQVPAATQAK